MKSVLINIVALALTGCGTMSITRVPATVPESTDKPAAGVKPVPTKVSDPTGVRVQVPAAHQVLAILPGSNDSVVFRATEMVLPSREEYSDLNFEGGFFKSSKLAVQVNPNGTLKSYKFERVDTGAAGISAAAAANNAITAKQLEIEKAKEKPAPANPLDEENAQLQREILNAMLRANQDAIQAGRPLPFPDL